MRDYESNNTRGPVVPRESEDHEAYLKSLRWNDICMYMQEKAVDVCTYRGHCRFKGELTFDLSTGKVPECKRNRVMKIMNILKPKK